MSNRLFGKKTWYAVQVGKDDGAADYGSTVYAEAERMARKEADNSRNLHKEIRIAVINSESGYCGKEIVIRPQSRLFVACRENGDLITECLSIDDGKMIIRDFEREDKADGTYKPDFYDIVWEDDRTSVLY